MNDNLDLANIERKTWTHQFKDGLTEIMLGWIIICVALFERNLIFGLPEALVPALMFVPMFLIFAVKKYIIESRIGKVKYAIFTSPLHKKSILYSSAIIIPAFIIYLIDSKTGLNWITLNGHNLTGLIILWLALIIDHAILAKMLKFQRLFYYICLMGGALVLSEIFSAYRFSQFIITLPPAAGGLILIMAGLYLFIKLLKKYPKPAGGLINES
ncbi:MAG: hypothetical protein H8E46_02640 [FCB group bacterium]|nr:hypothetical protein [FCB group bacterium]